MSAAKDSDALPALADYVPPEGLALDALQRLRERLLPAFARRGGPKVHDDRLDRAALATVEDYVSVPDCRVVVDAIDAAVDEWLADDAPNSRILLVAVPPCDTRDLVGREARRRGFEILEEPGRDALVEPGGVPKAAFDVDGDAVLAIPRLERWFVRHRHGLQLVRALLADIAGTERRCLVAVNSWGWRFVAKAARADLILPEPVTTPAFDARRLRDWLLEIDRDEDTAEVTVRAIEDSRDVLALDGEGELEHEFLAELVARGFGIPWVCWHLWRRGLRTLPADAEEGGEEGGDGDDDEDAAAAERAAERELEREVDTDGAHAADDPRTDADRVEGESGVRRRAAGDRHTLWVTHEAPLRLPVGSEHDACLVLQALLIHAFLEPGELESVLPIVGQSGIVGALERSGFVERGEAGFRCRPAAYPSIRAALNDAGYPLPPV